MGSLPNLHLCSQQSAHTATIRHSDVQSEVNSQRSDRRHLQGKLLVEATYSPAASSRSGRSGRSLSSRTTTASSARRRDSCSSGGTSLRRQLLAPPNQRSQPTQLGPFYPTSTLLKNLAVLSLAHLFVHSSLVTLQNLQASLYSNETVGTALLTCCYVAAAVSSLLAPPIVSKLTPFWTMIAAYAFFTVFFALHFHISPYTLFVGFTLLGLCLGPLYSAHTTFLMTLVSKFSFVTEGRADTVLLKFLRGFQATHSAAHVPGNLLASLLFTYMLKPHSGEERLVIATMYHGDRPSSVGGSGYEKFAVYEPVYHSGASDRQRVCGGRYCPQPALLEGNFTVQDSLVFTIPCQPFMILLGVFLGCSLMGVAITASLLDRIRLHVYQDPLERPTALVLLREVGASFKDPRLQLAAPLLTFIGMEQGFMAADFSKAYVTCAMGLPRVGFVFMTMGIAQVLACLVICLLIQHVHRHLLIGAGALFQSCLFLVLLFVRPSGDDPALFYVISTAWGVCNAIWETLTITLIALMYVDSWQAPMAQSTFFRFLGLALAFGSHGLLCNKLKIYCLAASLVVSAASYGFLEYRLGQYRRLKTNLVTL